MNIKNIILVFILILNLNSFAECQEHKTYNGDYQINNYLFPDNFKGHGIYQYYENDNYERIYDGDFYFKGSNNYWGKAVVEIKGEFKNNKKHDYWEIIFTQELPGYKANYLASGNIKNGKYIGRWETQKSEFILDINGNIIKTEKEQGFVTFENNHFVGEFKEVGFDYFNEPCNYECNGVFNKDGFLTGKLIELRQKYCEEYVETIKEYERGFCYKSVERVVSTGEILNKFDSTKFKNNFFSKIDSVIPFALINNEVYLLKTKSDNHISSSWFIIYDESYKQYGSKSLVNIFTKGTINPEKRAEKEIIKISKEDLLKITDSLNYSNTTIERISKSVQEKSEKIRLAEIKEKQKQDSIVAAKKQLLKDKEDFKLLCDKCERESSRIIVGYNLGRIKKCIIDAYLIIMSGIKVTPNSYYYFMLKENTAFDYKNFRLLKNVEKINNRFFELIDKKDKEIEKQLKEELKKDNPSSEALVKILKIEI